MTTAYQTLKQHKFKISLASILFAIAAITTGNIKFGDEYSNTSLSDSYYLLSNSKGYLTPEQALNPSILTSSEKLEDPNLDLYISMAENNILKDDNGNAIPPASFIKTTSKIKTLTLDEGNEYTSTYSSYFDSSYYYSYPQKNRIITYIPIQTNQYDTLNRSYEYICVGGAMKREFDEQKPTSKEQCISQAMQKAKLAQITLAKAQQENIEILKNFLETREHQKIKINKVNSEIETIAPLFASNRFGECRSFKNINRDMYIDKTGAFDSYEECYAATESMRRHIWWDEIQENITISLAIASILLAGVFILTILLTGLSKGASVASDATISFLSKASEAINQEKRIKIDATVNLKNEDNKK